MTPVNRLQSTSVTREELYALVWERSVTAAATTLGVSSSYLLRICAAMEVPTPPRGWTAKHLAGTAPPRPSLPSPRPGVPGVWEKGSRQGIKRFYSKSLRSASPKDKSHRLVVLARGIFSRARESRDRTHLWPRSAIAIDVTASSAAMANALALADTLFRLFEARGHPVRVPTGNEFIRPQLVNWDEPPVHTLGIPQALWTPKTPTIVEVRGVPIGLAIMELTREVLMRYLGNGRFAPASSTQSVEGVTWTEWKRIPTGKLKLIVYSPHPLAPWQRDWVESRANSLRRTASEIVTELEELASTLPHADFYPQPDQRS
jgi:hypothetical protein